MTGRDVVRLENVTVEFGTTVAVRDLSFLIGQGERVAVLGRTGAGKSTVLNLLIGNLAPTSGTVRVDGVDPYHQHRELQGRIGMAFQSPSLLPWATALANARVGLDITGRPRNEADRVARDWLRRVQLEGAEDLYPAQLSGGMRQRVSLARAFAIQPKLVLLDESFSALDEVTARDLRHDFLELCDESQATALIVTHSIEEAFELATRVVVFGSPAEILGSYDPLQYPDRESLAEVRRTIHDLIDDSAPLDDGQRTSVGP